MLSALQLFEDLTDWTSKSFNEIVPICIDLMLVSYYNKVFHATKMNTTLQFLNLQGMPL